MIVGKPLGLCVMSLSWYVASLSLRGVPPALRATSRYSGDGGIYRCLDGSKAIDIAHFNDNFCDCDDGSDEPGTGACAAGKFFCINWGHRGIQISSSLVDDGVCDCCDGSDEQPQAHCRNSCAEVGTKARQDMLKEAEYHSKGAEIRAQYVRQALQEKNDRESQLDKLKAELLIQEKNADRLASLKASPWKAEARRLSNVPSTSSDVNRVKNEPTRVKKEPTQPSQEIPPGIDNVAEPIFLPSASQLGAVENSEAKETEASANANERHAAPMSPSDVKETEASANANERHAAPMSPSDAKETEASANANERHAAPMSPSDAKETEASANANERHAAPVNAKDDASLGTSVNAEAATLLPEASDLVPELEPTHSKRKPPITGMRFLWICLKHPFWCLESLSGRNPDDPEDVDQARIDQLNADHSQALRVVQTSKAELQRLEKEASLDLGIEGQFVALKGHCFSLKQQQYTYKLCGFEHFKQDSVNLGSWGHLENATDNAAMIFVNGASCHQGPQRSTKVLLKCGTENKLVHVHEPERCVYEALFETPAICDVAHAERLQQIVAKEEEELAKGAAHLDL